MKISEMSQNHEEFEENAPISLEKPSNSQIFNQKSPISSDFSTVFPRFSLESASSLDIIETQIAKNPNYLDLPTCPYPPEVKASLRRILAGRALSGAEVDSKVNEFFGDEMIYDRIIRDSKRAYMNLATQMTQLEAGNKLDDAVAFTKALTAMQQRLLEIQDKAEGLSHIHQFKRVMLSIIESELTPDQRTSVMEKIQSALTA